jgi:hypothetical protein
MRAQHPLGEHLTTCSGPDNCAEYAAVLAMTPTEHARYINDSTLRLASARSRQFRASEQEDFTPPDAFAADIIKRREAEPTPESRFAEQYKAARLRELDAEHAEIDASIAAAPQPRLTAAELAEWDPPDPYAAGIKALQLKEASAR